MRKTGVAAPTVEPAPVPAQGERLEPNRYSLFSFSGLITDPHPGARFGVLSIPICGHYVRDKETFNVSGQTAVPSIDASTLDGTMEDEVLDFFVEDSGLRKLMHLQLKMEGYGPFARLPQKPSVYRGTYKHGHVQGRVELNVNLVLEVADFLVAEYPHIFRARKRKH